MLVIFEATKQIQRRAMELWVERQGRFLGFYLYPFEASWYLVESLKQALATSENSNTTGSPGGALWVVAMGSGLLSHLTTARRPAVNLHRVGCFGLNLDILDFPPPDFQQNDKIQLTLLTATHSSTACLPAKDSVETGKIGAFWKRHHILNSFLLKLYSMFGIPSAREWLFCFQVSPLFSVSLYRLGPFQVDVTVRAVL